MTQLLLDRGYLMPGHGSHPFFRALACRHELILVMEPAQQRQVVALAPELMGRVHLLGRWGQGSIEDPTGGPAAGYERCLDQLMFAVDAWMERLEGRPRALPARVAETIDA